MKPFYRPILDPVFKYVMKHEDIRNDFISSVIGEKVLASELLDEPLNPLPLYKDLRHFINQDKVQKLMDRFENIDPGLLVYNSPNIEIRSLIGDVVNFIHVFAPKYYQLIQAIPSPERSTQMDIVCETADGFINIEVQNQPQNYWDLRILDHVCGLFHRQFDKGFKWSELEDDVLISTKIKRSIGISILDKAPRRPENVANNLHWYNAGNHSPYHTFVITSECAVILGNLP
jgi:hypothetical protein